MARSARRREPPNGIVEHIGRGLHRLSSRFVRMEPEEIGIACHSPYPCPFVGDKKRQSRSHPREKPAGEQQRAGRTPHFFKKDFGKLGLCHPVPSDFGLRRCVRFRRRIDRRFDQYIDHPLKVKKIVRIKGVTCLRSIELPSFLAVRRVVSSLASSRSLASDAAPPHVFGSAGTGAPHTNRRDGGNSRVVITQTVGITARARGGGWR